VINGLTASGGTAGGAGLTLAYAQAEAAFLEGGVNHILLCTDGDFNIGISSTDELLRLVEEKRKTGVTLTALGFGIGNLNDAMMEAVSNAGNGIYSVISSAQQADEYVHERLLSTFIPIAKDMKIQLEFNADRVHAFRLLGYENRAIADEDFRDDKLDAGEVGAGHRVTALYQLILKGGTIPTPSKAPEPEDGENYAGEVEVGEDDLVLVKVRYKKPGASEEDEAFEVARGLSADDVAESTLQIDADFRWALSVAAFAEIVKKSPYAVPTKIDEISELVHEAVHRSDDDRAEFVTLFDKAVELGVATR
jgi:Ca-activated chloride channel family protein